jgi:hypothetical protein
MASTRGRASWTLWRIDHTASDYWHAGDDFGTQASGHCHRDGSIGVKRPPGLLIATDAPGVAVKNEGAVNAHRRFAFLWRSDRRMRRLRHLVHRRAGTNQIMIDTAGMVDRDAALLPLGAA